MANRIILKKSSVTTKVPQTSDLEYGEMALNYADEKLYFKNSSNVIKSFSITGVSLETLTIGSGLTGTSYNGTNPVTIEHADTSSVSNLSSDNSGNTFIQDISLTFDTFGHVTGATVGTGTVTVGDGILTVNTSGTGLSGSGTFTANQSGNSTITITSNATALNNVNTIVSRDASGNFAANTINASLSGNASSATALQNARTIGMSGDVTWTSAAFDGTDNVTGTSTLANSGVTAGTYGSSTQIPVLTVDGKGRLTTVTTSSITVGDGTLTLATSGIATGSQTFTANQATNSTFTVDVPATNIAEGTRTTTTVPITSSTGTGATLSVATTLLAGVMSSSDKTKLDGIETGAQVNAVTSVAGKTGVVTLDKADVGLGNVDNTADSVKSVASAATATTLQTARTINGVSFDGSANITVTANTTNTLTIGTGLSGTSFNGSGNVTIAIDSTVATLNDTQTLTNKTLASPIVSGSLAMGSNKITGLDNPTASTDAATKQYVDEVAQGLKAAPAVEVATTANLTATYSNGTAGVGSTLTSTTNGAFPTIDGVTVSSTATGQNGVLVKNQSTAAHNGRYNLTQVGNGSTPWILTRCAVCDQASEIPGSYVFVKGGTTQANTGWVAFVTNPSTYVVGTDSIAYFQFSGAGTFTAGTGLTLTGTAFSVNASQTQITSVGTLTGGTWNASAIAGQYGGTGVANTGKTITIGGNFTTSGAHTTTLTTSGNTNVTLPTTGTLATIAGTETLTNKTLNSPVFVTPALGTPSSGNLANCTFPTLNQNTTGSAATLTTTRTLWGQNFNGSANVTGNLTSVGNITGTGAVTLTATSATLALAATGANIITASTNGAERLRIISTGNVGIGTTTPGYKLEVNGSFAATSKSFLIPHPTKEGKKLRHGSLEGPEHGVYVRGKVNGTVIELPEYWTKLVDPDSITVQLTAISKGQKLYVEDIRDNKVYIANDGVFSDVPNCFYLIQAERVDIEKMDVEINFNQDNT